MRNFLPRTLALLLILVSACTSSTPSPTDVAPPATTPQPAPTITLPAPTATQFSPSATPTRASAPSPVVATQAIQNRTAVAGERSIGDPYTPELGNTGYDVLQYTLQLTLDPSVTAVFGNATINAVSTLQDLGQISLDLIGYEIDQVLVDGSEASYTRDGDKLVIDFTGPLEESQPFTLTISYSGTPIEEKSRYVPFVDHLGLFFQSEQNHIFAINEPDGARYWFPCNDHPRDKAAFRFELTVPEELVGVANGLLLETHTEVPNAFPDGKAGDRYIWEHKGPMATYLATVGVGDYALVEGRSSAGTVLRSYIFPEQEKAFESTLPLTAEMIDWMSEQFGPYPFEAFGFLTIHGLGASLESQTLVILDGGPEPGLMAHEMSHMWFGDWVSLDSWGDIWRNEGFATYIAALWENREEPEALADAVSNWETFFQDQPALLPLDSPPPNEMFGSGSYYRGAVLVHKLRLVMGDDDFFQGLKIYFDRYGGATATHEQFQSVMEEAAGKDLDDFFVAWLEE